MLKIKINKDISEYSEGMLLGLSIKEVGNLFIMCVIEIIMVALFSMVMPIILAVYLSMPIIICVGFCGKKMGNMTFKEILHYMPQYRQLKRGIEYSSTESPDNPMIVRIINDIRETEEKSIEKDK